MRVCVLQVSRFPPGTVPELIPQRLHEETACLFAALAGRQRSWHGTDGVEHVPKTRQRYQSVARFASSLSLPSASPLYTLSLFSAGNSWGVAFILPFVSLQLTFDYLRDSWRWRCQTW